MIKQVHNFILIFTPANNPYFHYFNNPDIAILANRFLFFKQFNYGKQVIGSGNRLFLHDIIICLRFFETRER